MSNSERMAPVDATWLRMGRPTNLMVIVGVLVLAGPVDVSRLEAMLAARLLAIPRFRQRTETRQAGTWWCDDPQFDITAYKIPRHVEFRDGALPKTNIGKILRRALREEQSSMSV